MGTSSTVDVSSPSSVLGGREAVVEARCVVRLEVGGRGVAVRCGPARRLRHVLRPVLPKYAAPHAARAVLRAGRLLHPDTLMQELDGARLQIVEVSENGEYRAATAEYEVDDDADSLSDLAVRLQDDAMKQPDEVSVGTASGSSRGSSGAGRVRAALRPGPPLHHHPPDFLENLRETQRQRLQSKGSVSPPSSPGPQPRSPPPLPPKPAQRAPPTVV
ncbi:unnamed protein product [Spodoptera exigua]|nr:unnamed protein product [Spodoptera exigua]